MASIYELPVAGRHIALDERGIGLRATWHLDRGFVNLSLWRDQSCVETFHLTPSEAGRLIGFLVSGLADAVPKSFVDSAVEHMPASPGRLPPSRGLGSLLLGSLAKLFRQMADAVEETARSRRW